jgi:rod shape determining protein RodA
MQSFIAVGSGKTWGKGWGNSTQGSLAFLPEPHSDFAFTVFAEEHGFVGCALLIAAYLFLVFCALDIASNARDRYGAFLAFGAGALFFWHAFINIGMVIGLLPVVGVPLLLVSYGGSSTLLTLMAIGVLLNVSLRRTTFQ